MKVTLPTGLAEGPDHFNIAIIDEIRGKQQNYLADRELVEGNIGHIPKILADVVKSIETKTGNPWKGDIKDALVRLPSSDLETLLVKIRENTYGPRYYFQAQCTNCGHINKDQRLDLDKLSIKKLKFEDLVNVEKRTFELPKSKRTVVLKPMYLHDMFEGVKIATDKSKELITSVVSLSIESIDGAPPTKADLENMPAMDTMFLEECLEKAKMEGDIDTTIEMTCSECGTDFESKLNVYEPDFFSTTRASKSTKR